MTSTLFVNFPGNINLAYRRPRFLQLKTEQQSEYIYVGLYVSHSGVRVQRRPGDRSRRFSPTAPHPPAAAGDFSVVGRRYPAHSHDDRGCIVAAATMFLWPPPPSCRHTGRALYHVASYSVTRFERYSLLATANRRGGGYTDGRSYWTLNAIGVKMYCVRNSWNTRRGP